jgi:hydroxyacid-oxoacid transhydrogenase
MSAPIRALPTAATRARSLLYSFQFTHSASCPCHSNSSHPHNHGHAPSAASRLSDIRRLATPATQEKEYAFEMAASNIRFGRGATKEVGMDFKNLGASRVVLVTDATVAKLPVMKVAREALEREGIHVDVFDKVNVEPKDYRYDGYFLSVFIAKSLT